MPQGFRLFRIGLAVGLSLLVPLLGGVGCSAGSAADGDESSPTGSGATGGSLGSGGASNPGSGGSAASIGSGGTGGTGIIGTDGGLTPNPETCELDCTPVGGQYCGEVGTPCGGEVSCGECPASWLCNEGLCVGDATCVRGTCAPA